MQLGSIFGEQANRKEVCSNGQGRSADRWLQLELVENQFYQRYSADGKNWVELPCSLIVRNDMINLALLEDILNNMDKETDKEMGFMKTFS